MARYFWNLLLLLDQAVNTVFGPLLNFLLRPEPSARFGDPRERLSSVFGKNVRAGKCKGCRLMCIVLNWLNTNHCANSIQSTEGSEAD